MIEVDNSALQPLITILLRAADAQQVGWLYLPKDDTWQLDSPALMIDVDKLDPQQVDENDEPLIAIKEGLVCTLDSDTLEDIYSSAKALDGEFSESLLFEAFLYYYTHDAFLPYSGFKPLPVEQQQMQIDKDFYDCLGEERTSSLCKKTECKRGVITASVLCRVHHFEMIKHKTCPFDY